MAMATARETGITCDECGTEFILHQEYVYYYGRKLHQGCASTEAAGRRDEGTDPLTAAREILSSGTRVVLNRAQLRTLVALAVTQGLEPVHKPDSGRHQWYGRLPGWSAARVKKGLAASEVAGMWEDFLAVGRMPPLRTVDLSALMDVIDNAAVITAVTSGRDQVVTIAGSLPSRYRSLRPFRDLAAEGTGPREG
jgi:hypothetical protein